MHGKFYTTSESAWSAMLAAITSAKESIYLEMYIFDGDTKGYDFLKALELKAREGVHIIVIVDALGSRTLEATAIAQLESVGVEVRFFSYWLRRTHRKLLIIDQTVVFLGGVNISGKFSRWSDLQVRLTGRIAKVALYSFAKIYRECGGANPALVGIREPKLMRRAKTWFLESGLGKRFGKLRAHYTTHIDDALHSIVLVTPYLVPHRSIVTHLHRAILRGVRVILILPEHTDHATLDRINYYYASQFEKLGAHCLLSPTMNHAKAMLIDQKAGTVGSHNLDVLSFNWNVESGVFFDDKHLVGALSKIITRWQSEALPFPGATYTPKWYDIFLVLPLRLFQRGL